MPPEAIATLIEALRGTTHMPTARNWIDTFSTTLWLWSHKGSGIRWNATTHRRYCAIKLAHDNKNLQHCPTSASQNWNTGTTWDNKLQIIFQIFWYSGGSNDLHLVDRLLLQAGEVLIIHAKTLSFQEVGNLSTAHRKIQLEAFSLANSLILLGFQFLV